MSRQHRWLLSVLITVSNILLASGTYGQVTNVTNSTSTPTPGSGHDYINMVNEAVNPANGAVSIRVETPVPRGRGLTIPFNFAYDSNGAHILRGSAAGGSAAFGSNITFLSQNGWSYAVPLLSANYIVKNEQLPNGRVIQCEIDKDFVFQDPSGGRHALHLAATQQAQVSECKEGPFSSGGDDFVSAFHANCFGSNCPVHVADADGTVYSFAGPFDHLAGFTQSGASLPTSIEDRNGNKIVVATNSGTTTYTDTAGRSAVSFSGFGTSGNTVNISGLPTNSYTVAWGSAAVNFGVNPVVVGTPNSECNPISSVSGNSAVISAITLPNSRSYQFDYRNNVYGLVDQITYPTGGWIKYTWALNPQSEIGSYADALGHANSCVYSYDWPAIQHRYVSFDGTNIALQQDFSYSIVWASGHGSWLTKQTIITTHDCARNNFNCTGAPTFTATYSYTPVTPPLPPYDTETFGAQIPVESTVLSKDWTGVTLQTVGKTWSDQYKMSCESTTLPTGQISRTDYGYGQGLVITDKKDWDWGQAPACGSTPTGTPARERVTAIQSFANTLIYTNGPSIFDRPSSIITYGAGSRVAETDYAYDQFSMGSALSNLPAGTHDETFYGASVQAPRGNVTTLTKQCISCTNAVTTFTYDETGQTLTMKDPCGNTTCTDVTGTSHVTTYSYSDSFASCGGTAPPSGNTNAYLTKVTNPLGQFQSSCYGYNDGQLRGSTDFNNQPTKYIYGTTPSGCSADELDRLGEIDYPDGGSTQYCYNDSPYNVSTPSPSVTTTKAISVTTNLNTLTAFDGVGHTVRSVITSDPDCSSGDRTDTVYDGVGHVHSVTNPYCSTTNGLSTYAYDALGRIIQVTNQDSSTILTTYTGRATQVQDEGNGTQRVTRISQSDGLGRLVSVCEVTSTSMMGSSGTPASCGLDISATGFLTTYQYDALDNVKQVTQSGLGTRTFNYDSLSRLASASNPESGTICYGTVVSGVCQLNGYDVNGNLATKVSPKPNQNTSATVTATYSYDVVNRLQAKSYSDSTPAVTYSYDQTSALGVTLTNTTGRRSSESTAGASSTGSVFSYDTMGRITNNSQCTPQNCGSAVFGFQYTTYDLLGDLTSATNAAGITFNYGYNRAGRLNSMTTNFVDGSHPGTLLSSVHYTPFGQLSSSTLGNTLTESLNYDQRLRLQSYSANSGSSARYSYSLTFAPDGDVQSANDSANGNWGYAYDAFNRLSCSNLLSNGTCTAPTNGHPTYTYAYDRFGNRWQQNGPNSMIITFSGGNNRIDGYSYDAAGNLLNDKSHNYFYDAENRLVQVDGTLGSCSTAQACYVYDAEGLRARKTTAAGSVDYLYDKDGNQVSEVATGGVFNRGELYAGGRHLVTYSSGSNGSTFFHHNDWLGTERTRTDVSGSACETIASLPFGDGQTTTGSCADISPMHFTGNQRDSESGLDNFGARYLGSSLGRFMSTDPGNSGGYDNPGDPQGWDAYSYVRNNPLNLTDPDGRDYRVCVDDGYGGQNCTTYATLRDFQSAAKASSSTLNGNDQSGQILIDGKSIGTYRYFVGPGTESLGVPDITADYFFHFPALFSGVKAIFSLGRAAGAFELTTIGSGARLAGAAAAREALKASGGYMDLIVQTSAGPVRVLARVEAEGETAVIKELAIYPSTGKDEVLNVGLTELRQGIRQVLRDLKQAGYSDFRMEPQYRSGGPGASGGANPFGYTGTLKGKL